MRLITLLMCFLLSCQTAIGNHSHFPDYPVTPQVVVKSTFKVILAVDNKDMKSGTAWVVESDDLETRLITAGHMCKATFEIAPGIMATMEGKKTYRLQSQMNKIYEAEEVWISETNDLCMIKVKKDIAAPLKLALLMPDWGDEVFYVGAPRGIWGDGVAMAYKGLFAGINVAGVPTAGGASGAAFCMREGCFGVLIEVHTEYHHITVLEPLDKLLAFITECHKHYPIADTYGTKQTLQ